MDCNILKLGTDPILHFEVVGRLRSLKLAAKELGLSQPAVTHSLSKLENNLGVKLCVRTRTHFALTEAGKRLFMESQEIKRRLLGFQGFLEESDQFDGIFSVGILANIFNVKFERALHSTMAQFPNMKMNVQAYTAELMQDMVSVGELDIGIGLFKGRSNLAYKNVGEETICHYISDRHHWWRKKTIHRKELKGACVTWLDIVSRNRAALEAEVFLPTVRSPLQINSYANNLHAATLILQSGTSIVPFPDDYLDSRRLDFKYRRLDKLFKPYKLKQSVVYRTDFSAASAATTYFLDQL